MICYQINTIHSALRIPESSGLNNIWRIRPWH